MNQITTQAVVLARVDYQEADRILTLMTKDHGKISVLAKGVRRIKSRLAGGIELFSISEITYIESKKELHTLISARLETYYEKIVTNLDRTQFGYQVLKTVHKLTDTNAEDEYYTMLTLIFEQLNDFTVPLELIDGWFAMQLLELLGQAPNLQSDTNGERLKADQRYNFDFEAMSFVPYPNGVYAADHIKIMRLALTHPPQALLHIKGLGTLLPELSRLSKLLVKRYL